MISLDPWPLQPYQKGAQSSGNTAYFIPGIPGASVISFWLQSIGDRPNDEFMLDMRDAQSVYEYNGSFYGFLYAYCGGNSAPYRAFLDSMLTTPRKMVIGGNFTTDFRLFSRVSEDQKYRAHRVSELRIYGRNWSNDEIINPRGAGPEDSILARYDFQDLSNGILRDLTGNGHNGRVIGDMPVIF